MCLTIDHTHKLENWIRV